MGRRRGGHCDALASVADHGHFGGPPESSGVQAFKSVHGMPELVMKVCIARAFLGPPGWWG